MIVFLKITAAGKILVKFILKLLMIPSQYVVLDKKSDTGVWRKGGINILAVGDEIRGTR